MARMYMGKKAVEAKSAAAPQYNTKKDLPIEIETIPAVQIFDDKQYETLKNELTVVREELFTVEKRVKIAITALFILNLLSFFI